MTHNKRNTSIKIDQELIQMLELAEKDTKAVTALVTYIINVKRH